MLRCHLLSSPDQKFSLVKDFDVTKYQIITGSLDSKLSWQRFLLERLGGLLDGERVLRASELWRKILLTLDGRWRVLPSNYMLFAIEKWMGQTPSELGLKIPVSDRQMALDTLIQLLPMVAHQHGLEAMQEWFAEHPQAKDDWQDWYVLGLHLWGSMKNERVLPESLIPGFLINEEIRWPQPRPAMLLDLGLDMSAIEGELIVNLSREVDIDIMVPQGYREGDSSAYCDLLTHSSDTKELPATRPAPIIFGKYPTMLAEVKEAVHLVRKWLDEGIPPFEIIVTSPVIENFWPTLMEYFNVEGIPVDKKIVAPYSQKIEIQQWLSTLKLSLKQANSVHVKQFFFLGESTLSFKKYRRQFENLFSVADLARDEDINQRRPTEMPPETQLTLSQFLTVALEFWPPAELDKVSGWLTKLDSVWSDSLTLSAEKWLEFLELYFARQEFIISPAVADGVRVGSLEAIENWRCQRLVILGLTADNVRNTNKTQIPLSDVLSIRSQYGYYLDHQERGLTEKQISWVLSKQFGQAYALVSEADFSGTFHTPSWYWLEHAVAQEKQNLAAGEKLKIPIHQPQPTRWDLIGHHFALDEIWPAVYGASFTQKIQDDLARTQSLTVRLPMLSLSASTLETYHKCPFQVLAKKGFQLSDDSPLDLDLDPGSRGGLFHKVFELVLADQQLSLEPAYINDLIARAVREKEISTAAMEFWPRVAQYFFKITRSFIEHEINWRQMYPNGKPLAQEVEIKGYIQAVGEKLFTTDPGDSAWPVRGSIDRIDSNDLGEVVLIDYKSTKGSINQYPSWLKNGNLQLLFYALALRDGLGPEAARNVVGAFYFIVNDFTRDQGIHDSRDEGFLKVGKKSDEFVKLLGSAHQQFREMLVNIKNNDFSAAPRDADICKTCSWDKICRRSQAVS